LIVINNNQRNTNELFSSFFKNGQEIRN